ncbi:hypothetical protein INR49_029251, partial [Caranx melampygus]
MRILPTHPQRKNIITRSMTANTALQLASPSSLVATQVYKPASLVRQSRIHSPPESWASDGGRSSSLWNQVSEGFGNPASDTLSRISQPVPTAALRSLRVNTGAVGSCVRDPASGTTCTLVTLGLLDGMSRLGLDPGTSPKMSLGHERLQRKLGRKDSDTIGH